MYLKAKKDSDGRVETTAILLRRYSFHARPLEAAKEVHLLDVTGTSCTYFHYIYDKEGRIIDGFQCRNGVATTKTDRHGWLCHQHKPRVRNREVPVGAWETYSVDPDFITKQDGGRS